MSDLLDLCLYIVHWILDVAGRVLAYVGLEGGLLDRLVTWAAERADVWIAAALAAVVLVMWTVLAAGLTAWFDRRVRARVEGRIGPRYVGAGGILQGLADWLKLMLRRRRGMPSALAAAVSGALVLAALALLPLGPWARLADPDWGLVATSGLLALSAVPMAAVAPVGSRHARLAEAVAVGVVLMLAVAAPVLVTGTASAGDLVAAQARWGWGVMLMPLGFLLFLLVMYWESDRLVRVRGTGVAREDWPGPHVAMGRYVVAARYFALGVLGTVVFLGGWSGPVADGAWWTLLKAYVLVAVASLVAGVMPLGRPGETARAVRNHWLPLAALNLVVVATIMEVMA